MNLLTWFKQFFESLGGASDAPQPGLPAFIRSWWWRGIWWGLLIGIILLFCGQSSKFIYIDF